MADHFIPVIMTILQRIKQDYRNEIGLPEKKISLWECILVELYATGKELNNNNGRTLRKNISLFQLFLLGGTIHVPGNLTFLKILGQPYYWFPGPEN